MMTNGESEGRTFLSHPRTNNGFLYLFTFKYRILCLKKLLKFPEYAEMRHVMMTSNKVAMTSLDDHVREFQINQCTDFTWQPG